jgi:hypothetical protein
MLSWDAWHHELHGSQVKSLGRRSGARLMDSLLILAIIIVNQNPAWVRLSSPCFVGRWGGLERLNHGKISLYRLILLILYFSRCSIDRNARF